jgi:5-methylthioadenosine/S-adenosylhomocysteine deaminase
MADEDMGRMNTADAAGEPVVFVDLVGTLVSRDGGRWSLRPETADWLRSPGRLGVLCNGLPDQTREEVRLVLDMVGLGAYFDPDLVIVAPRLGCPLPDPRAFAVAAVLAETAIDRCAFASSEQTFVAAAAAAGMRTIAVPRAPQQRATLLADLGPGGVLDAPEQPALLAAKVDEDDLGPTFVLKGRIVAMSGPGTVVENGRLVISRGFIRAVVAPNEVLPSAYRSAQTIETSGTIYPGLIDLHNHFAYNILPLWAVPKQYENRSQWQGSRQYVSQVSLPMNALKGYSTTARAIVRYAEAKALIGGTTTGQGIRTQVRGGLRLFRGAMRNVEATGDVRLPEAGTLVPTLRVAEANIEQFRSQLERRARAGGSYFYHLAEGVNADARETYSVLLDNDLLRPPLAGIHCLGLQRRDLELLASKECRVVWSPFSNLLLYGRTLDLEHLKESEALFSIGCDWSPTGSKNLLQELKLARHVSDSQGGVFDAEDLVRAVTADAARIVGWQRQLGTLAAERMADLLVLDGDVDDPFEALVNATESEVRLVAVHGIPRYGDRALMEEFPRDAAVAVEEYIVGARPKFFALSAPDSTIDDLTVGAAEQTLLDAMSDLPAFRKEMEQKRATLSAFGIDDEPEFEVLLDNETFERTPEEAALLADWDLMAENVELDGLAVDTNAYFERVDAQRNISDDVKRALRDAYA